MLRADDIAGIILARVGVWTDAMKLQKLLYYTQAWHLAITDRPLFRERVRAWTQGPVVYEVWNARQEKATRRPSSQSVDHLTLGESASNLIDLIIAKYGAMSGGELSKLTHAESPWLDARGDLPPEAPGNAEITREAMAAYYRSHGLLEGRTAADLAAGGIYLESADIAVDYDALLATLDDDLPEDTWGGANLHPRVSVTAGRRKTGLTGEQGE